MYIKPASSFQVPTYMLKTKIGDRPIIITTTKKNKGPIIFSQEINTNGRQ